MGLAQRVTTLGDEEGARAPFYAKGAWPAGQTDFQVLRTLVRRPKTNWWFEPQFNSSIERLGAVLPSLLPAPGTTLYVEHQVCPSAPPAVPSPALPPPFRSCMLRGCMLRGCMLQTCMLGGCACPCMFPRRTSTHSTVQSARSPDAVPPPLRIWQHGRDLGDRMQNYRVLHMVRRPELLIASAYRFHKGSATEGWLFLNESMLHTACDAHHQHISCDVLQTPARLAAAGHAQEATWLSGQLASGATWQTILRSFGADDTHGVVLEAYRYVVAALALALVPTSPRSPHYGSRSPIVLPSNPALRPARHLAALPHTA